MKRLILIRHGQAEESAGGIPDFERSLTSKGKNIARQMAEKFKEKMKDPGTFVTSPAFRAFETAAIFGGVFGKKPEEIILSSNIYTKFNKDTLNEILKMVGEDEKTVTLFGHNPSFSDLASWYSSEQVNPIPKSGIISITFNIMIWSDLRPANGSIELFLEPKKIL